MPWVQFTKDYEFKPRPNVILVYRAGKTYLVSQTCAAMAIDSDHAMPTARPERGNATRATNGSRPSQA